MTYSSAVNGRDSFQGVAASAVRVFPAVTAGQPVPPPFVTAVAKIICNSDSVTVCEARKRVCIPQVVKIEYDQASVDAILSGYISDNGTVFIQPIPSNSWAPCRVQIAMQAQAYYSAENVNVRFVDSTVSVQQPHTIMQMDGITQSAVDLGETPLPFDEMNTNPSQMGFLYYFGFRNSLTTWYQQQEPSLPHPNVTNDELVRLFARTATHETGHALGLVSSQLSGGGTGIWEYHNQFPFNFHLMDPGPEATLYQKMGRDGVAWTFNLWNSDYLRFILPRQ